MLWIFPAFLQKNFEKSAQALRNRKAPSMQLGNEIWAVEFLLIQRNNFLFCSENQLKPECWLFYHKAFQILAGHFPTKKSWCQKFHVPSQIWVQIGELRTLHRMMT